MKDILANATASGRVNVNSIPKAYLIQASVHLHEVYKATDCTERRLPKYGEKEFAAAEAIIWLIAYLQKINCPNIEQLLRDVIAYRREHPDKPRGPWPY